MRAGVEESDLVYINMCYKYSGLDKLKKREEKYVIKHKQLMHFRQQLIDAGVENPDHYYPPD